MVSKGRKKGTIRFAVRPPRKGIRDVAVAGDFNGWAPMPMRKQKNGDYVAIVEAPPGAHQYKYVVDGEWVTDPDNSSMAVNTLGTLNSVAEVE